MACRGCSFRSTTRAGVSGSERRSRSPRRPVAAALPAGDILRMDCELLEVFGGCTAWGDWCVRAMLWAHLCSLPHLRHKHGPLQLDAAGHVYPAPPGRSHGRIVLPAAAAGSGGVSLHPGLREASPGQGVNRRRRMSNRVAGMLKALAFGPACSTTTKCTLARFTVAGGSGAGVADAAPSRQDQISLSHFAQGQQARQV